ncbi:MAG: tail fiber domain-containing protein [Coprobacillus sp.]|nr:tail fiber domain-containing protein [Coprobacillus sp.]
MINYSDEYLQAINSYNRSIKTRIHIEEINTDIEEMIRSCSIEQMSFSENKITFGDYCSNKVTITIDKSVDEKIIVNTNIDLGMTFYIEHGIEINDNLEFKKIGYFTISNIDENEYSPKITITAYDCISRLNSTYIPSVNPESTTAKEVLNDIEKQCGIKFNLSNLFIGTGFNINKLYDISCAEMVSYIASYYGKNFRASPINKNEIEFYWYEDCGFIIDENNLVQGSLVVKLDKDIKINSLKSGIENISNGEADKENSLISVGDGYGMTFTNPYITENILINLLNKLSNFKYRPLTLQYRGNPCLQAGDIVTVIGSKGTYKAILSSHTLYLLGMNGTVECKGISETEESLNSLSPTDKKIAESQRLILQYVSKQYVTLQYVDKQYVSKQYVEESIIGRLEVLSGKIDDLDVGNLEATYAKIDLSNVNTEHVGNLLVDAGLITDLTIVDGHVTGDLTGVRIHGDLIDTNTLKVKNLLLEGPDGLIYQINALASGLTQTELTEEIYNQKMLGSVLVNQSVTTEQLNTKEIFSNSAVIKEIFAQDVTATGTVTGMTLKGGSININEKFIVDSLGNGKFSGEIEATSGTLKNLIANNLNVETGQIANFNIDDDGLHVTKNIQTSITDTYFSEFDRGGATLADHDLTIGGSNVVSVMIGKSNQRLKIGYDGSIEATKINGGYITPDFIEFYDSNTNDGYTISEDGIVFKHKQKGSIRNIITTFTQITKDMVISGRDVYTNAKTSPGDGKAGGCLNNTGNLYLASASNPYLYFYRNGSTTITHSIAVRESDFLFSKSLVANGGVRINNASVFGTYNSKGTPGNLIYCANDDRIIIGTSSTDVYGNMDLYSGDFMRFHTNSNSTSYKATVLELFREQSDSHRTILRPASNSGAYLGTTTYRWNTAFFTNNITASDLKEKEVIEDFDFKAKDFIMGLEPIAYRRKGKEDTGERIHIGLGAQPLAKHIKDLNLGDLSMVQASIIDGESEKPYHGEDIDDSQLSWGINYTELTPYLILMIKEQQNEINSLKKEIDEIKQMILKQEDK